MPETATACPAKDTARIPRGLVLAATGWLVVGAAACGAGLGSDHSSRTGTGLVGSDVVASTFTDPSSVVLVTVAGTVWLLSAALIAAGQGWALYPLSVLGAGVVISLALSGSLASIAAMVGLVLGTAPLLSRSAYAFVAGGDR